MSPHHAVCVTGLQRSYPEISGNIVSALESLYAAAAGQLSSHVAIFGVRPANDSWKEVRETLPPLTNETLQRRDAAMCGDRPPAWFSVYARSRSALHGFQQAFLMSLCDQLICLRDLVEQHEQHAMGGRRFRTLARLRLDLAWEAPLRMPPGGLLPHSHAVFVPRMNAKAGVNDKWAIGLRRPMGVYLARIEAFAVANRLYGHASKAPALGWAGHAGTNQTGSAMMDFECAVPDKACIHRCVGLTVCSPRFDRHTRWQGAAIAPLHAHGGAPTAHAFRAFDSDAHGDSSSSPRQTNMQTSGDGGRGHGANATMRFALTSEAFLQWALWRQNVTVVHVQSWMFCKYKDAMQAALRNESTPRSCVPRMRYNTNVRPDHGCKSMTCMGNSVDCSCHGDPCTIYDKRHKRNETKWYCTDTAGDQLDENGRLY